MRIKNLFLLIAVAAFACFAQGAFASELSDGCLWLPQMDSFSAGPQNTITIEMTDHSQYNVSFNGICDNADWANGISFPDATTDEFCAGDRVMVGHELCISKAITPVASSEN